MAEATSRPRRLVAGSILVAVSLLGLAACTKSANPDQIAPGPTGTHAPTAGPTGTTAGNPSATAAPTVNPAVYPQTARVYADWVLAAWRQHQTDWLGELTTPEVQAQIVAVPGSPDLTWVYSRCDGAAGSTYCRFTNATGDVVTLQVSNALLTKQHAVVGMTFDATAYPLDAVAYATAFISAWQDGNLARMKALASPDVVTSTASMTVPASPTYSAGSGGAGLVQVTVTAAGFHLVLQVGSTLLGAGHAIVGWTP
jgi:hypothetical protein